MAFRTVSLVRSMALPARSTGAVALGYWSTVERSASQPPSKLVNRLFAPNWSRFRMFSTGGSGTTGSAKDASNSSKSFLQWYEGHLQNRPVTTKMVTGAFLWGLGDGVAQIVPRISENSSSNDSDPFDWIRTGRAMFFGFALHAPASHLHFNLLEWMTQRLSLTGLKIPIFKAFMEQFVYWSWFSNSLYHGAMGAMQGLTPSQIYHRIEDVLWETQVAQWKFWIPIQLLNFQFVPVRHQLNVVLVISIVWTALLSAWYPPEKGQKK